MAEIYTHVLFMVHADTDDDDDDDTLIFYSIQADRAFGTEISPRSFVISFVILQADRAYGTEISPRLFVVSFVILLYAISYNICI